jgi:hypothetical protein
VLEMTPQGTPLKRKSLMPYSGGFFRFLAHIKGIFLAVDLLIGESCSPAFLLFRTGPDLGLFGYGGDDVSSQEVHILRTVTGRVWNGINQPTVILYFFSCAVKKRWVMAVSGDRITWPPEDTRC